MPDDGSLRVRVTTVPPSLATPCAQVPKPYTQRVLEALQRSLSDAIAAGEAEDVEECHAAIKGCLASTNQPAARTP